MSSRRAFMIDSAGFGLLSFLTANTLFIPKRAKADTLHEQVLANVKKLTRGKTITLTILYPEGSLANIEAVTEIFQSDTGVKLILKQASVDDINTEILLNYSLERFSHDIALPATFGISDLAEAGAIARLDKFAARYEPSEYRQGVLYSLGDYYKEHLYGYQTDGDTYMMFYKKSWLEDAQNQQLFAKQHGYPLRLPKTWQELDAQMAFFHQPERGRFGGCLFRTANYAVWEWWIRFHAKGYFPVNERFEPQINNAAGIAALDELLAASKYLHPDATTNGLFENWKIFSEGNVFCNIGWGGTQKYLNGKGSKIRNNLLYGPTPGGYVNQRLLETAYFNWGWNYVVSSLSPNKELAYLFALYACSPEISTRAVREVKGYFDPFREIHYQDADIQQIYTPEFLQAHKESMQRSIPDFYVQQQSAYFNALRENIDLALAGHVSTQQALDLTAREWQYITQKVGSENQIRQWQFLKSTYPKSLSAYLR